MKQWVKDVIIGVPAAILITSGGYGAIELIKTTKQINGYPASRLQEAADKLYSSPSFSAYLVNAAAAEANNPHVTKLLEDVAMSIREGRQTPETSAALEAGLAYMKATEPAEYKKTRKMNEKSPELVAYGLIGGLFGSLYVFDRRHKSRRKYA